MDLSQNSVILRKKKVPHAMLTQDQIQSIELAAQDVLASVYGSLSTLMPPVNLEKVLQKNNITYMEATFKDPDIDGVFVRNESTIYVSQKIPFTRKTFTVGHELGHFFLHRNKDNDTFHRTQQVQFDQENNQQEAEANWFAASLLMPERSIRHFWELTNDLEEIAKIFIVSQSAAYYRLKNLKLIHE